MTGQEQAYIADVIASGQLSGDGPYTRRCTDWLARTVGTRKALLTPSCTAALEMAAILCNVQPGDEVIMPSFTFVSTANAFALRGATPVFIDIRPDTLNLDESLIEAAITPRTKAIVPVHYAGVSCDMARIMALADQYTLLVVEDAAQCIGATHQDRSAGSIGHFGAISFHATKNLGCGEGGALFVNDERFLARAEIIREKGTNRSEFLRGETDKYTWRDIGSSYLLNEISAAFLWSQLEHSEQITRRRMAAWNRYHESLAGLEAQGVLSRPNPPRDVQHNGHIYHVLLRDLAHREKVKKTLHEQGIGCATHYVALDDSAAGLRLGRAGSSLSVTRAVCDTQLRLPLYDAISSEEQDRVVAALTAAAS